MCGPVAKLTVSPGLIGKDMTLSPSKCRTRGFGMLQKRIERVIGIALRQFLRHGLVVGFAMNHRRALKAMQREFRE
jgi:hypothetical protein